MLSSRSPIFLASFAAALLFAGCLLNGGPLDEGGNGGSAGSSNTGASTATSHGGSTTGTMTGGTGGTGGSNNTTSSTDPPECTGDPECDNGNPCRTHTCQDGTCHHDAKADGNLPDNDLHDCERPVCKSGEPVTEVDKSQIPDVDSTDCVNTYCLNEGGMQGDAANNGQLCGSQPANQCQENVCDNKQCVLKNKDGQVLSMGNGQDCRDTVCMGDAMIKVPNYLNCPNDPDPTDCTVWSCNNQGNCGGAVDAPEGVACKKQNGTNGSCDSFGNCD